jgi:mono/diheme cytochrome c family protein
MRRIWAVPCLIGILPSLAFAQDARSLDDKQKLGMRLFNQSCQVCHTGVLLNGRRYGPALSRDSLGGQDDVMREVIGNGTPRMPGFKYTFTQDQIVAIAAYLKAVPPQAAAAAASAKREGRDAD